MSLMLANSKGSVALSGGAPEAEARLQLDTGMLLRQSLQKTSMCFSLDHCFQPDAVIELSAAGTYDLTQARIAV